MPNVNYDPFAAARLGQMPQGQQMPPAPQMPPGYQQGPQMPAGLDPAMLQAVLALNQQSSQQGVIDRQRKMADLMRSNAQDQMRGVSTGKVYRAPGALNLAANVAGNFVAARQDSRAEDQQKVMADQRQEALRRYFDAMTGREVSQ